MDSDARTPPKTSIEWCITASAPNPQSRRASHKTSGASPTTSCAASTPTRNSRPVYSTSSHADGPLSVRVGDKVQVFWDQGTGEGEWYAGEVTEVCKSDETYCVHYFLDHKEIRHAGDRLIYRLI